MSDDNKFEQVTIDRREYNELISDRNFLDALMSVGVDNWEGYDLAQELMGAQE